MSRVLITTFGSYGDLHPYLAMGRVLAKHGHSVIVATHPEYREQTERLGLEFAPVKPSLQDVGSDQSWIKKANHPMTGTEFVIRRLVLPFLDASYVAILEASRGCDLIISHFLTFAAPVVAEQKGIPWFSSVLQPSTFLSAYDPPAVGPLPFLPRLRFLGPRFFRLLYGVMGRSMHRWLQPLHDLRSRAGLPPTHENPLLAGFSKQGVFALFPDVFASPQPDWPPRTEQLTFPLFDEESTGELSPSTRAFLDAGEPPYVFTLGSAIVLLDIPFFEHAYQAIRQMKQRAVFLVGREPPRLPEEARRDPRMHIASYEPFSKIFPAARAIVHQCGIGTTAQALRSGRPQLLVPFAHDQFDNARRCRLHGVGEVLSASRVTPDALLLNLTLLLENPSYAARARDFAAQLEKLSFEAMFLAAFERLQSPK